MVDEQLLTHATPSERRYAEAIAEYGSAKAAADALGVAHGTITGAMCRLRAKAAERAAAEPVEPDDVDGVPTGFGAEWVSTEYDADGNVKRRKVSARRDKRADSLDDIKAAFAALAEPFRGTSAATAAPEHLLGDQLTVYGFGDPHIGQLSWGRETGDDWDLEIARDIMARAVDTAVATAKPTKYGLVLTVGDTFHANDPTNQTPKHKHNLDTDGRHRKILETGFQIFRYAVDRALTKHEIVYVFVLRGNHDPDAGLFLNMGLSWLYENNPRVIVDTEAGYFSFLRFGKSFLGFTHGDTKPAKDLPLLMATRRPDDWAASKFRHWYTGHIHHESLKEYAGAKVESLRTLAAKDAHAHEYGYDSERAMVVHTWHREFGRVCQHDIGLDMLDSGMAAE